MALRNILLTTDFSDDARKAYPVAASLSKEFSATLHLAHVAEKTPFYFFAEGYGAGLARGDFWSQVESHLTKEARHPLLGGVEARSFLISDKNLVDGIAHFEKEKAIDLTVISPHGRSAISQAFLGGTANKLIRILNSPVLTCRGKQGSGAGFEPKRILVPYDFSANAEGILPMLRLLAAQYVPEFLFLFVVEPLYPVFSESGGFAGSEFLQQTLKETPRVVEGRFRELKQDALAGIDAKLEFADGVPAAEIVKKAKAIDADLILMTTHGWTGMRHFLLGSVAESVVRKAPCSTLTVRSTAEPAARA